MAALLAYALNRTLRDASLELWLVCGLLAFVPGMLVAIAVHAT